MRNSSPIGLFVPSLITWRRVVVDAVGFRPFLIGISLRPDLKTFNWYALANPAFSS